MLFILLLASRDTFTNNIHQITQITKIVDKVFLAHLNLHFRRVFFLIEKFVCIMDFFFFLENSIEKNIRQTQKYA